MGRDEEAGGHRHTGEVLSDFGSGSEKPCEVREVRRDRSEWEGTRQEHMILES